jgi:hypothetical protein
MPWQISTQPPNVYPGSMFPAHGGDSFRSRMARSHRRLTVRLQLITTLESILQSLLIVARGSLQGLARLSVLVTGPAKVRELLKAQAPLSGHRSVPLGLLGEGLGVRDFFVGLLDFLGKKNQKKPQNNRKSPLSHRSVSASECPLLRQLEAQRQSRSRLSKRLMLHLYQSLRSARRNSK